ncbi:MAG TPA: ABC-F family ATPase, partial [Thermoanaerobaculia bacterium]|nr:ABC-F family ATPase [Thermoanaerobaculia bacterium]
KCGDDHLDADTVVLKAKREKKKEKATAAQTDDERREAQKNQRRLVARRNELTGQIEKLEGRVHAINETFCDPTFFERTPRAEVTKLEKEQKDLAGKIEALMGDWEEVEAEIDQLDAVLAD